jgi:DDE_Tnp_1-associated
MLEALITELGAIEDPRCGWKVEHRLIDVLVIAVCAVLGEAESFEDIQGRRMRSAISRRRSSEEQTTIPLGDIEASSPTLSA